MGPSDGARSTRCPMLSENLVAVAGPDLAQSLTNLCLIDEYRPYFRAFGRGKPSFAGPWRLELQILPYYRDFGI
jgi:hypothetical protein